MRHAARLFALFASVSPLIANAAGTALTANFSVIAPDEAIAQRVATQAETFRKQAALEWFGKELPSGKGPVMVHVALSEGEDKALSWCKDSPAQKFHRIWLTTSADKATGSTLNHEVVHTVIATFLYPEFIPAWANEGIASQYDDAERKQARELIAARWATEGRWPRLQSLFTAAKIEHTDTESYAAAASVARFLASLGGKPKVVEFAKAGLRGNWDRAVRDVYGARDVAELQARWQGWVRENIERNNHNTAAIARPVKSAVN
jgi:hypothetical protein